MNAPLKVTQRVRHLTLRHVTSGATRRVEYLGTSGIPLRAQVHWPLAGDYFVNPVTGRLLGESRGARGARPWEIIEADRRFLELERRIELARRHCADKERS